jgi:hypothetical protein
VSGGGIFAVELVCLPSVRTLRCCVVVTHAAFPLLYISRCTVVLSRSRCLFVLGDRICLIGIGSFY